ncbi:hypothetical protein O181_013056 [Austropuccinia psidii MF-1]|uniref:Uncharacterized protein n=1 Tax=Austropuccinia psidii MF-1 TaxID=1389203 RepID=A0A9Q3BVP8_9BASI|nr:hypothetical protein [Austropuccinia psidii MF-1]
MPITVLRQRRKSMPLRKSQRRNPPQRILNQTPCDALREQSDKDQYPRDEFLVEYQEERPLEIQEIGLEAGIPQGTASKNLCKNTQDAQKFLVTPTNGMA